MPFTSDAEKGPAATAVQIALTVGGLGSLAAMLWVGRRNPSHVLLGLFALWILGPFVLLWLAGRFSRHWSSATRATLRIVSVLVPLVSLGIYADEALRPHRAQGAFMFVVVPVVSYLAVAVIVGAAALLARRRR